MKRAEKLVTLLACVAAVMADYASTTCMRRRIECQFGRGGPAHVVDTTPGKQSRPPQLWTREGGQTKLTAFAREESGQGEGIAQKAAGGIVQARAVVLGCQ